jgi:ABC-type nitrate/sulfonate/bicarbonate transport system permease component
MKIRSLSLYLCSLTIGLCIWQLFSLLLGSNFFPSPLSTFKYLAFDLIHGELLIDIFYSFRRVSLALLISVIVAHPLGLISGQEKEVDAFIAPIIQIFYPVPKIIFLPIIFLLLGLGDLSKIVLIALKAGFQILVISRDYSKGLNREYFDALTSLGGNKFDAYIHILLPSSLPTLFTALRINMGTALGILFISESYATDHGIGAYIMDAFGRFHAQSMLAGTLAMTLMGAFMFFIVNLLDYLLCPWKKAQANKNT